MKYYIPKVLDSRKKLIKAYDEEGKKEQAKWLKEQRK